MDIRKSRFTSVIKIIIQAAPILMIAVMGVIYFTCFKGVTVQDILDFTPNNTIIAIFIIIGLFALKSLSFFFPMLIIIIASGSIFPLWLAIIVNTIGVAVQVTIPYLIGRFAEREFVMKLVSKNKKSEKLKEFKSNNEFFLAFILRVINITPCDLVSMILGSMDFSYKKYILGSLCGIIPGMVATTIVGSAVSDPASPKFIISLGGDIFISAVSVLIYMLIRKKKKRKA
jgi:uncharacterized membrane protein YdjX (TVP38/TMEM64 family)